MALRVLVADDDPMVGRVLRAYFDQAKGIELVAEASDAQEAVSLATQHRPDVVVLDWAMPGGGGPRAAEEISSAHRGVGIVGFTAYEGEDSKAMLDGGAHRVVVKGTPGPEVLAAIRAAARDARAG